MGRWKGPLPNIRELGHFDDVDYIYGLTYNFQHMSKLYDTPLSSVTGVAYQAINSENASVYLNNAVASARSELLNLQKKAEEGDYTWKVGGLISGLLMIFYGLTGFISHLFGLSPFSSILDIYILIAGVASVILEYKESILPDKYRLILKREALILYRPYGRAAFYVLVGLLLLSQGGLLGTLLGLFISAVGAVVFYSSWIAYKALGKLKAESYNESTIRELFRRFDKDNSGALDTAELSALCVSLGSTLSKNELEAALQILDKDNDDKITYEEFLAWWQDREEYV